MIEYIQNIKTGKTFKITSEMIETFAKSSEMKYKIRFKTGSYYRKKAIKMLKLIGFNDNEIKEKIKTTAITLGKYIYIPFKIGQLTKVFKLIDQFLILVHEITHAIRARIYGVTKWYFEYVTNKSFRTYEECETICAEASLCMHIVGRIPTVESYANRLKGYYVEQKHINLAQQFIHSRSGIIFAGFPIGHAAEDAFKLSDSSIQ